MLRECRCFRGILTFAQISKLYFVLVLRSTMALIRKHLYIFEGFILALVCIYMLQGSMGLVGFLETKPLQVTQPLYEMDIQPGDFFETGLILMVGEYTLVIMFLVAVWIKAAPTIFKSFCVSIMTTLCLYYLLVMTGLVPNAGLISWTAVILCRGMLVFAICIYILCGSVTEKVNGRNPLTIQIAAGMTDEEDASNGGGNKGWVNGGYEYTLDIDIDDDGNGKSGHKSGTSSSSNAAGEDGKKEKGRCCDHVDTENEKNKHGNKLSDPFENDSGLSRLAKFCRLTRNIEDLNIRMVESDFGNMYFLGYPDSPPLVNKAGRPNTTPYYVQP